MIALLETVLKNVFFYFEGNETEEAEGHTDQKAAAAQVPTGKSVVPSLTSIIKSM